MDYGAIIAVLSFLGAIKLATNSKFGPVFCSLIAVGAPFLITLITSWVFISAYDMPILENLVSIPAIIAFVIQFVLSLVLFKKLQTEDNFGTVIGWSIVGFVLIVLLVPFIIHLII